MPFFPSSFLGNIRQKSPGSSRRAQTRFIQAFGVEDSSLFSISRFPEASFPKQRPSSLLVKRSCQTFYKGYPKGLSLALEVHMASSHPITIWIGGLKKRITLVSENSQPTPPITWRKLSWASRAPTKMHTTQPDLGRIPKVSSST